MTNKSGFSLVEMMVALTAGSVAVSAAYFIGGASSHHFQEQQDVAQLQTSVRLALDQVRRDVARAGFLGSPNSDNERRCTAPPFDIQAVEFINDDALGTAAVDPDGLNGTSADRLRLVGSYATSDWFLASGLNEVGTQLYLQTDKQAFQRNFGAYPAEFDAAAFDAVFNNNRMVRIETDDGEVLYATIAGTFNAGGLVGVSLGTALPLGAGCPASNPRQARVSVLSRIEYAVVSLGGALAGNALAGAAAQLIRREIQFNAAGAPVAGTERVLLEYVADFNLRFIADTAVAGAPPNFVYWDDATANTRLGALGGAGSQPHQVRSVVISISGRAEKQSPKFTNAPRATTADPLLSYRIGTDLGGAARVRTVREEVFMPNIVVRSSI